MTYQQKDQLFRDTMDAIYEGFVTIIDYVRRMDGTDYITGQTFKKGVLHCHYNGNFY